MNFIDYIWNDIKKGAEWLRVYAENSKKRHEEQLIRRNAELDSQLKLKHLQDAILRKERALYGKPKQEQQFNSPEMMFGNLANRPSMLRTTRSSKGGRR